MRRIVFLFGLLGVLCSRAPAQSRITVLRYAHMNPPESIAGMQAALFARKVEEYSGGSVRVEVFPASLLGSLEELIALVSDGTVTFHHNTAAAFGTLLPDIAVLDTPYIYRDVTHLIKAAAPDSPLMRVLGDALLKKRSLRVLYTFYFGTRVLTCDRPIRSPEDLRGLRIRAIPFPLYEAAVEGLGGIPTPIDWAMTPTALAAKAVNGQENPVNTILTSRLYESQSHVMRTNHILGAEIVVVNENAWRRLSRNARQAIDRAAREAAEYATRSTLEQEEADLVALAAKGMRVIDAGHGLDIAAFRENSRKVMETRFGSRWTEYYRIIGQIP